MLIEIKRWWKHNGLCIHIRKGKHWTIGAPSADKAKWLIVIGDFEEPIMLLKSVPKPHGGWLWIHS